jgi:hypothetical protein
VGFFAKSRTAMPNAVARVSKTRPEMQPQIDGSTDIGCRFVCGSLRKQLDLDKFRLVAAHDEVVIPKANLHGPAEQCGAHHLAFRARYETEIRKSFAYLSAEHNA